MALDLAEWLQRLQDEYVRDFIPSGGAAVKIAVAPAEWSRYVLDAATKAPEAERYQVVRVDSAQTRVHMIDQVFHSVARQIPWEDVTGGWLRSVMGANGIRVEEDQSLSDLDGIAEANGRSRTDLFAEINRLITNHLSQNHSLAREFRTAIGLLSWAQMNPQNVSPSDADIIKQWLLGEKCSLATLKRLQIYGRIGRHNGRMLLNSLAVWLHEANRRGLLLLLDLTAVIMPNPAPENLVRYTRSTTLDVYEVLRQFIDDTDEVSHLLLLGVAGPGLIEDPKRNVDNYTALKLRIIDDVRDRQRANPLNVLVRLGDGAGA